MNGSDLEDPDALLARVAQAAHRASAWYWTAASITAVAILTSVAGDLQRAQETAGLAAAGWLLIGFAFGAHLITANQQRRLRAAWRAYAAAAIRSGIVPRG